jgi:hypothetical protein
MAASSSSPDSSPFVQTPQHLPLHVRRMGRAASPLVHHVESSSSPVDEGSDDVPGTNSGLRREKIPQSLKYHHSTGRYRDSLERKPRSRHREDEVRDSSSPPDTSQKRDYQEDQQSDNSVLVHDVSPTYAPIESPFRKNPFDRTLLDITDQDMDYSPTLSALANADLRDVLLPVDDPLLDIPPSPGGSSDSWESLASETETLEDKTNDDDTDVLLSTLDDRFIDSGWGGECLRDTEDIDFEFVYALHTFVATVEGQANATKGDTMVLLDDSNSYWWLVRVVKDSSIGEYRCLGAVDSG